ncbi:MAG: hypothetical protein QM770_19875 [Tepidisphaeraceae bacterium]
MNAHKILAGSILATMTTLLAGSVWVMAGGANSRGDSLAQATVPATQTSSVSATDPVCTIRFSNGAVAHIIALAEHGDRPALWWHADGSTAEKLDNPRSGRVIIPEQPGARVLQAAVELDKNQADDELRIETSTQSVGGMLVMANSGPSRSYRAVCVVPKDAETFDLKLGMTVGPWSGIVLWQAENGAVNDAEAPCAVADVIEDNGNTTFQIRRGASYPNDPWMQFIATLDDGSTKKPNRMRSENDTMSVAFDVPKDEIKKLTFGSRKFEYVTVKNVSTHPSPTRTNVEIVPPATQPVE